MNLKFHNALKGIPQKVPPIWFMRQAGRYHKHYQQLKTKHSFMELCKQPKLAAEVTLGPIEDFDFDVAILFSDLLFPLEVLGMGLKYEPGPILNFKLNETNINQLKNPNEGISQLHFQAEAIDILKKKLGNDKSLIGFVGGPWTLFSYAVQGTHDGHLLEAKKNLPLLSRFMEILMPLLKQNIELQLNAGAEVVMLFDTSAGALSPAIYREKVIPYLKDLAQSFPLKLGYYARDTHPAHYEDPFFKNSNFLGLGFDHRWNLPSLLPQSNGFVQGNFDQALLFLHQKDLEKELNHYLNDFKKLSELERKNWVCGLGHGVLPATPEENVRFFIRYVREFFS
jgi:uroporphyrinogen decarboxylase